MANGSDEIRKSSEGIAQELREDIESTRQSLGEKVQELETRAREVFDLDHQMHAHPLALLGASTGAGFVLGALTAGSPRPAAHGTALRGFTPAAPAPARRELTDAEREMGRRLKVAAMSFLAGYVRKAVRQYSSAWGDELDRVWQEHGMEEMLHPQAERRRPSPMVHHPEHGPGPLRERDIH